MKNSKTFVLMIFLVFTAVFFGFTESFRVHKTASVKITEQNPFANALLGINDALFIQLPQNNLFLQGIEMEIKIPPEAAAYRDAVAFSLYKDLSPRPAENLIDYTGERLSINAFPGRLSYNIKIPFKKNHSIKASPYSIILPVLQDLSVKNIFFRLQLVMKGASEDLLTAMFLVEVKPIFTNEGLLDLQVQLPNLQKGAPEKPFLVFIDESPVEFTANPLLLPIGLHHLNIVSDYYRNEVRTFSVNQTKTTKLEIQLKDIAPLLKVSLPANTRFFINNIEQANYADPLILEPGDYQLRFSLGDHEIIRNLTVVRGRTYLVGLAFDVQITEE